MEKTEKSNTLTNENDGLKLISKTGESAFEIDKDSNVNFSLLTNFSCCSRVRVTRTLLQVKISFL